MTCEKPLVRLMSSRQLLKSCSMMARVFGIGFSKTRKTADPICYSSPVGAGDTARHGLFENVESYMDETRTIHVERIGRTPTTAIELVHSPDDGGYYLGNTDFQRGRQRVSLDVWPTSQAALAAFNAGTVRWEDWRGGKA